MTSADQPTLLLTCGAIAREVVELIRINGWDHLEVQCLPANLHAHPEAIPGAVKAKIEQYRDRYEHIFVAYADCGTGGLLDKALEGTGIERLPGAHCYEFFAGSGRFGELSDQEPGTFYLTDFLVKHFERLVWNSLGLDRNPKLLPIYFGNYRRLVYLAQTQSPELLEQARQAADRLGLAFQSEITGYGDLEPALDGVKRFAIETEERVVKWQN